MHASQAPISEAPYTLEDRMAQPDFVPTLEEGLSIARKIGGLLQYGHEEMWEDGTFLHLNIHPAHVIYNEGKIMFLTGWAEGREVPLTPYMAPELWDEGEIAQDTDVYGLGQLLAHYFLGDTFLEKQGQVTKEDWEGADIPQYVRDALHTATQQDSERRFCDIEEMLTALENPDYTAPDEEDTPTAPVQLSFFESVVAMAPGLALGTLSIYTLPKLIPTIDGRANVTISAWVAAFGFSLGLGLAQRYRTNRMEQMQEP